MTQQRHVRTLRSTVHHAMIMQLLLTVLLHLPQRLLRHCLSQHPRHDVLFACLAIADRDQNTGGDVDRDTATQNSGGKCARAMVIGDAPGTRAQCDLEEGVAIEEADDGDKEAEGKGVVRGGLVGFVKRVRIGKFVLVMHEFLLLCRGEQGVLSIGDTVFDVLGVDFLRTFFREIVVVLEFGKLLFSPETPGQVVIVRYEAHVICINNTERGETITHYREQGDQDVVDNIDNVVLLSTDVDPACVLC